MIQIKQFYAFNELRNFSYLIYEDRTGRVWAIDPYDQVPLADYIRSQGLILEGIINTHQHFDHIRGNAPLQSMFHCEIRKLKHEQRIELGENFVLETMDTPGHTLDHQVFLLKQEKRPLALFSGDTLFNSGVGNCHGGGDVNLLYQSTMKLMDLPDSTLLYPGHDYRLRNLEFARTIEPENQEIDEKLREVAAYPPEIQHPNSLGEEKLTNPFLRLSSKEVRQHFRDHENSLEDEKKLEQNIFIKMRKLRDTW